MRLFNRAGAVPGNVLLRAGLARGEKVLAHAEAVDGSWLLGTRARLVLLLTDDGESHQVRGVPWEQIEDAAWDRETSTLRVDEIGTYGEPRPTYSFEMHDPVLLLQLVRERVTASLVLQRWVPVRGRLGLKVIGRRSPVGGPVAWMYAYDPGLDPADPEVAAVAGVALAGARAEVGDASGDPI